MQFLAEREIIDRDSIMTRKKCAQRMRRAHPQEQGEKGHQYNHHLN
jgi:hypothetical protein